MGTDALRLAVFRLTHITDVISLDFREALGHYFAPDFFAYFFCYFKISRARHSHEIFHFRMVYCRLKRAMPTKKKKSCKRVYNFLHAFRPDNGVKFQLQNNSTSL